MTSSERQLEEQLVQNLRDLKFDHRADIRDRAALERNFREQFQALNRVELTEGEFQRLLDEIITPDVFSAAKTLRGINSFTRDGFGALKPEGGIKSSELWLGSRDEWVCLHRVEGVRLGKQRILK